MTPRMARAVMAGAVAAAVLACYGPFLNRGFTSEDFLLIRFLTEHPPWRDFWASLGEPWLGIAGIRFLRPVSTLLYGAEISLFGTHALAYNIVHVAVHIGNAITLASIARRFGGLGAALAAGLLFGLYPLSPNAVLFTASFATLSAAGFLFAAFAWYLRWRRGGGKTAHWLALGLFGLALGSYEAAVVFPVWLAGYEHLLGDRERRHFVRARGYLPFVALLACYFGYRRWALGAVIGGYEGLGNSLLHFDLATRLQDLATSLHQLHLPLYRSWPGPWALALAAVVLLAAPLAWFWMRARRTHQEFPELRTWLLGLVILVSSLSPFAFQPAVPGNGRYWYLAAAGAAMMLAAFGSALAEAVPLRWRWAPGLGIAAIVAGWAVLLLGYLTVYRGAAGLATEISRQIVAVRPVGDDQPMFLAGVPAFVLQAGTPVAPVFHYGLWDALHWPFSAAEVRVYPLPSLPDSELLPLWIRGAPGQLWRWQERSRQLHLVAAEVTGAEYLPAEIAVLRPPLGHLLDPSRADSLRVGFLARTEAARYRLAVVARGNATFVDLAPATPNGLEQAGQLPDDFLATMRRLYGGEVFWWIEARDDAGSLVAQSQMRTNHLTLP